ncbi:hypothetical protein U9M48_032497 [Paspalum notatum var. saurae]|uniref:Uncharacterized protein n=1 Tax=Paspalum notatum var. saurae TaxID=547442 RepID=A0AAQ3X5H1_PASNO
MHDVAAASEILSQRLFPLRTAISIPLLRPPRRILVPVPVASRRSVATLVTGCSKDCKIKRVEIDLECIAGYTCFSPTNREIKATCAEMEIVQKEKVKPTCHEVGEQSMGQLDPWFPPFPPCPPTPDDIDFESCRQIVHEWFDEVNEIVAASRRTQIIAPDRTPEKIFLDSIRLLGKHTDNLVDEINGNGKPDGFYIIISHILSHTISLVSGTGQNGKKKKQLEVEKTLTHAALLLVHAVCQAGESLDKYIMSHPEGQFHLNNDSQSTDSYLNTGNVPLGAFLNNPLFAQTNSYM